MRESQKERGVSIVELLIVMALMGLCSGILLVMYGQSRKILSRGMVLTELEQKARISGGRLIPKIASACVRPATDLNADGDVSDPGEERMAIKFPPPPPYAVPLPSNLNPPREVVLFSTKSYVRDLLRQTGEDFKPRNDNLSEEMREYRLFFVPRIVDVAKYPDGILGDIFVDGNTPADNSDDIRLVSGVRDVRFDREPNNVIRLTISVKAYDRFGANLVGAPAVLKRQHVTKIYLPIFTHSPGG